MKDYTVIMAIKNGEKYVKRALESIMNQSLPPKEILVINDGSTDRSESIVENFGISVIQSKGSGQMAALNTGLEKVDSDLVSFLDCDDYWSLDKQEKQTVLLDESDDLEYVFCQVVNVDLYGNSRNMGTSRVLGACTFRVSFVKKVGCFDESLQHHGIVEWWGREEAKSGRAFAEESVGLFRLIHGENSTILDKDSAISSLMASLRVHLKK